MIIGYCILILIIILQGIFCKIHENIFKRKIFLLFSFVELWFLVSLRAPTFVTDDFGYLEMFYYPSLCYVERGYCLLNNFIRFLGTEPYILFGVLALLVFIGIAVFIYRYSANVILSVLSYICLMYIFNSLNGIRQFLALAIIFISFPLIQKRQLLKFILATLFACLFHKSAIICLSFYWLYNMKINLKNIFLITVGSIIVFVFFDQFSYLYTSFGGSYAGYITREAEQGHLSVIIRLVLNMTIALSCLVFYKKGNILPGIKNTLPFSFLTICACISAAGALISLKAYMAERIVYYFYFFNIITIPNMLNQIRNKSLKGLVSLLVLLCLVSYGAVVLWSWEQKGIVYSFFWQY